MKFAILPIGGFAAVAAGNGMIPETVGVKRKSARIGSRECDIRNSKVL